MYSCHTPEHCSLKSYVSTSPNSRRPCAQQRWSEASRRATGGAVAGRSEGHVRAELVTARCVPRACRVLTCLTSSPVTCIFIGHSALFSSLRLLNGIPDHALQRSPHLSLKSYMSVSSSSSRPWRTVTPVMKPDGHCIARWSTLLPSLSKLRPRMPVHSPRACGSATTSAASTRRAGILAASRSG